MMVGLKSRLSSNGKDMEKIDYKDIAKKMLRILGLQFYGHSHRFYMVKTLDGEDVFSFAVGKSMFSFSILSYENCVDVLLMANVLFSCNSKSFSGQIDNMFCGKTLDEVQIMLDLDGQ